MISKNKVLSGVVAMTLSLSLAQDVWAKVSDGDEIFRQVEKIDVAIKTCEFKAEPLEEIKNKALGTSVISGVATVASGVGVVASAMSIAEGNKNLDKYDDVQNTDSTNSGANNAYGKTNNPYDTRKKPYYDAVGKKVQNQEADRIVATVANGVATGANTASFVMSLTSWNELGKLMDSADDCVRALDDIKLTVPEREAATKRY